MINGAVDPALVDGTEKQLVSNEERKNTAGRKGGNATANKNSQA